jgi:hypothetical protein
MSSVGPIPPQPQVQPTTGATNVGATTPAGAGTTTQPGVEPEVQSAVGRMTVAKPVVVNGLQGLTMAASGTANRFSRDTIFDTYVADGVDKVARGYLRCDATAIPGGCRVHVETFHSGKDDKITLYLMAEVLDTKTNQLRAITLAVLANAEVLNAGSYRGERYFDVSYADINRYLQARNPALKVSPGATNLAVAGSWPQSHQAGGFSRGGIFRLPALQQTQNAVSVRAAARGNAEQADLPLDMQVAYPPALTRDVPQLKPDGNVLSRLESEFKGATSKEELTRSVREMYRLAEAAVQGKTKDVETVLGKDWTVETVNRYWLKDDGTANLPGKSGTGFFKGFRVDIDGLPIQDPMRDTYMDDGNLGMTRHEGAIRLRTNKQATVINVKPGGGRLDSKSNIVQRIEVGVELRPECGIPEATAALQSLGNSKWSGTPFNHAQSQVCKLDPKLALQSCLQPWLDVVQNRHKFTVKNVKTGVEVELSFDKVECTTTRPNHANPDGSARTAEFYVLEAELDHLQLVSQNQGTFAAANSTSSSSFTDDLQQDQWLAGTSPQVTMDLDPRLHELDDLDSESFRNTSSYTAFKDVIAGLIPTLFPKGMGPGRQKAAHAAELCGLVHFSDAETLKGVQELVEKGGYQWSPALASGFDAVIKDPQQKAELELSLVNGSQREVGTWVSKLVPNVPLDYDLPKIKTVVAGRLASLGFQSTPEIDGMLDKLTPQLLSPGTFDWSLRQMETRPDPQVLAEFAQRLGVAPVPVPKPDVARLLKNPQWKGTLSTQLDLAYVDPGQQGEINTFLEAAAAHGATVLEIRQLIGSFKSGPQDALSRMAQQRGLVGKEPQLRTASEKVAKEAAPYLRQFYLVVDDEMRKFLKSVSGAFTPAEAQQWVRSLGNGAEVQIEAQAQRLGIPAPKFAYDFGTIDSVMQAACTSGCVLYDATLKQFVRDAVTAGVPTGKMRDVIVGLANQPVLSAALKNAGVYLVGLKIPTTQVDLPAIEAAVRQSLSNYSAVMAGGSAIAKLIEDLLGRGLAPAQAQEYLRYLVGSGSQQAARYARYTGTTSLPPVPVDVGAFCTILQKAYAAQWTPELEQYIKTAYPQAEMNPSFALTRVFNQQKPALVAELQRMSGMAPPAGI